MKLDKPTQAMIDALADLASEKLAIDLAALDVSRICSYTDALLICHGASSRQAQAIAEHVRAKMKERLGAAPYGSEGSEGGQWIVMDYGAVILHIFYEPIREIYDLEGIWADAVRGKIVSTKTKTRVSWPRAKAKTRSKPAEPGLDPGVSP